MKIIMCVLLTGILVCCAGSRSGDVYSRDQSRAAMSVRQGTVLQVSPVEIEGTKSAVGPLAGGATGAAVGSAIGGGSGRTISMVLGGLVGAGGGAVAEEKLTRRSGLEITVQLESGETIAVVQEADEQFFAGESVRVLSDSRGNTRVRH